MGTDKLRIQVLGPIRAWRGTHAIDLGPAKQRSIFAILALFINEPVPVGELAASVWSGDPPPKTAGVLHTYISRLRRLLEPGVPARERNNIIIRTPRGYQLNGDPADVDALRVQADAASAARLLDGGDWQRALELLGDAVRAWQQSGPSDLSLLLPDDMIVQGVRQRFVEIALQYVTLGLAHDEAAAVLPVAERLAHAEPLNELIQAEYLRSLAQTGQRAAAMAWHEDLRARLRTELGVDPGPELGRAYQSMLEAAPVPAATPPAPPRPGRETWRGPGPPAEQLVGRAADLAGLGAALARQRLVTLIGAPGSGKSVLARAVGREALQSFVGGVFVVDLHEARDEDDIRRRLVDVTRGDLGRDDWDGPPAGQSWRRRLVVFDNADPVTDACARLVDELLRFCPSAVVAVTSREVLRLPYETVWPVLPLATPPSGAADISGMPTGPAVELFIRRACQAWSGFDLAGGSARSITSICRRLDGLPLALEAAAASLRTTDLGRLACEIDGGRLRFGPGLRGTPDHQRSLYEAIRWSYDRLQPIEQHCLHTMSSLGPRFTAQSAARCWQRANPGGTARILPLLDALADRSLLYVEHSTDDVRYRMLEPIRTFAQGARSGLGSLRDSA